MTINPHPHVLTIAAEQRHREVLTLVARERRARQVTAHAAAGQHRADQSAALPVASVLARLLADVRQAAFPLRSLRMSCS